MAKDSVTPVSDAPLQGLVLAGGRGTRLQRDKGELDYHGMPQARWALDLLEGLCEPRFVSVRADQAGAAAYRDLPLIIDVAESAGPWSGLLAALRRFPAAAWLVIAADMPLLDRPLLASLAAQRDSSALATAYRHREGTPEPLCTIWEPKVLGALENASEQGTVSLRRLLQAGPAKLIELGDDLPLSSVNTLEQDARVRRRLAGAD